MGLEGLLRIIRRVLGVMADLSCSGVILKPRSSPARINLGIAPESFTISG